MAIPIKRGASALRAAAVTALPIPGYEKTVSASAIPPNNSLNYANCKVIAGIAIFLSPCLITSCFTDSPLALANNI